MHDVAYFKEENSGRTITVCRDTTAAALIGLRAMLLFKARHEWACEWVKSKGNSRLDEVAELNVTGIALSKGFGVGEPSEHRGGCLTVPADDVNIDAADAFDPHQQTCDRYIHTPRSRLRRRL